MTEDEELAMAIAMSMEQGGAGGGAGAGAAAGAAGGAAGQGKEDDDDMDEAALWEAIRAKEVEEARLAAEAAEAAARPSPEQVGVQLRLGPVGWGLRAVGWRLVPAN